jgi:hypothetical protein
MSTPTPAIQLPTRRLDPKLVDLLHALTVGEAIRVTQTVRVGAKTWTTTIDGTFRGMSYLSTGVTTDRIPEDDIIVPTVHFTKPNGELASIALDERTVVVRVPAPVPPAGS